MATYNGADKRLQYLFSHIGDGSNLSGTAQPTDTAVDNTLYIQYDANDGSVVALWVYLNNTWTEVETAGGNLYGTSVPTEEADEGALYIQYDSSDYSITALWAYIGSGWREISTGGGSSTGNVTAFEMLWENDNPVSTSGFSVTIDGLSDYDYIGFVCYYTSSGLNLTCMNIYDVDSISLLNAINYVTSGFSHPVARVVSVSGNTITFGDGLNPEVAFRSDYCIPYRIYGMKQKIQETALIYSNEEREVGVWTDGKPLYQKTLHITSLTRGSNSITHGISDLDYVQVLTGTYYYGNSNTAITLPFGDDWKPVTNSAVIIEAVNETNIKIGIGSNYSGSYAPASVDVTLQYTKTTDTAGSGTYITTGGYAHHYSTMEHVVGTWIDGSALYEITVATGGSVPSDATTLIDRRAMSGVAYDVLLYLK